LTLIPVADAKLKMLLRNALQKKVGISKMGLINRLNGVQMTRKKGTALADNVTVQVVKDDRTSTVVAYSVRKEQVIEAIFQK
jgi:hypothetical protein